MYLYIYFRVRLCICVCTFANFSTKIVSISELYGYNQQLENVFYQFNSIQTILFDIYIHSTKKCNGRNGTYNRYIISHDGAATAMARAAPCAPDLKNRAQSLHECSMSYRSQAHRAALDTAVALLS